jgi:hypothetical protein
VIPFSDQVAAAARAAGILSQTRFHWRGRPCPELPARTRAAIPEAALRSCFVSQVEQCLYRHFYCTGGIVTGEEAEEPGRPAGDAEFVEALARANSGAGSYEDGWVVRAADHDHVIASRQGLRAVLRPVDLGASDSLAAGSTVRTRLPPGSRTLMPGFYLAVGDQILEDGPLVRLYWNSTPEGTLALMRWVTSGLNRSRIPFRFKTLNDPRLFPRCDAAVLYVPQDQIPLVHEVASWVHRRVARHLHHAVPALTKPLAPGVGLAESPPDGESFGMSRCRLIAEGLVRAYESGRSDARGRLEEVESRFREAGISIELPFLNPGSFDRYRPMHAPRGGRARTHVSRPASDPLEAAVELGTRICLAASRRNSRCHWIGPEPSSRSGRWLALGPDLYAGSAGIALVLAELHRATGDSRFAETALGAARQSLDLVTREQRGARWGLYDGRYGALLAIARTSMLLRDSPLLRATVRCARETTGDGRDPRGFDLISGRSGAIVALLALEPLSGDGIFLRHAVRLGDRLLRISEGSRHGISWRAGAGVRTIRNLTGLAHGAAGPGLALMELFHSTGLSRFRTAAEDAFAYENHWFDQDEGNWPDFRLGPGSTLRSGVPRAFGEAWCHGAPGIALSRLRAYELTGDARFERDWVAACTKIQNAVVSEMDRGPAGLSLCHGLGGRCDVLIEEARRLGGRNEDFASNATRHLRFSAHADRSAAPGLMLGLAGRAYLLLRLARPDVPSLLLPRPEAFMVDRRSR